MDVAFRQSAAGDPRFWTSMLSTLRSSLAEKGAQQLAAFLRELSAGHYHLMVEPGVIQHLQDRADCAGLGIGSGIDRAG